MSKRQIFLVYDCDDWKSTDSMRLCLATTSVRRLKSFIAEKIERGDFYYDGPDNESPAQSAKRFRKEFETEESRTLNDRLTYGFFDYTHDGEEI